MNEQQLLKNTYKSYEIIISLVSTDLLVRNMMLALKTMVFPDTKNSLLESRICYLKMNFDITKCDEVKYGPVHGSAFPSGPKVSLDFLNCLLSALPCMQHLCTKIA
jgi:hypothetical protein